MKQSEPSTTDLDQLFDELLNLQAGKSLPPVEHWQPEREGEIDIRIAASGAWFHEGGEIRRQPLVDLFATILRRDEDEYFLVTPVEKLKITVEDVPFIAIDLDIRGTGQDTELLFTTNVGDFVMASEEAALSMRGDKPYLHVRRGLDALLSRSVFYRLVDAATVEGGEAFIYSAQTRFSLGAC